MSDKHFGGHKDLNEAGADVSFVGDIFQRVYGILNDVMDTFVGPFFSAVEVLFSGFCVIFMMAYGFGLWYETIQKTVPQVVADFLKLGILAAFYFNWSDWLPVASSMLLDFPGEIVVSVLAEVSGDQVSPVTAIDGFQKVATGHFHYELSKVTLTNLNIMGFVMGGLLWVVVTIMTVVAASLLLRSIIMVVLLLLLTPVFLTFMVLGQTKEMTTKWISQLLNYALIPFFIYILMFVVTGIFGSTFETIEAASVGDPSVWLTAKQYNVSIIMVVISILLLLEIPSVVSSITGGISLSARGGVQQLAGGAAALGSKGYGAAAGFFQRGSAKGG